MNNFIYYSSLSSSVPYYFLLDDIKINDKTCRFYNKNYIHYYPHFLATAGHNYKNMNFRNEMGLLNTKVLGDSGGHQIKTERLKWKESLREKIFLWLENNTDVAINIDFPPDIKNKNNFDYCLKQSIENFKYFETHQTGKTDFLNVWQLNDEKLSDVWFNKIKHFNFKGYALAFKNDSNVINQILYSIAKFKESNFKNIEYIHYLGLSSILHFFILNVIQNELNKTIKHKIVVSTDSSTPALIVKYGYFIYDVNWNTFSFNKIKFNNKENIFVDTLIPCKYNCFNCNNVSFSDLKDWNKETKMILTLHNLNVMTESIKEIQNILQLPDNVKQELIGNNRYKLQNIIKEIINSDEPMSVYNKNKEFCLKLNKEIYKPNNKRIILKNKNTNLFNF